MPTLEMHPLRSAMQFRLATFRYPIPVFDQSPDVVTDDDEIADLADEIAEATSEIVEPGQWPLDETTATPQVPAGRAGDIPAPVAETMARKGGQAR